MYKTKTAPIERCEAQLHGWDSQTESWHGPIPLTFGGPRSRQVLAKVRSARGAFQGNVKCSVPGLPCIEFHTTVNDLGDAGLAIIHMEGVQAGPVGILAVVPRTRRRLLRNDFAFELMTLISFLGSPVIHGCELAINDYIEEVLRTETSATQVFAVETAETGSDTGIVLSAHFEQLAAAMVEWMAVRESRDDAMLEVEESSACTTMPGGCLPAALPARCIAV